jgi:predicted RNase H-like nuclease (RuvC/YqgF family)
MSETEIIETLRNRVVELEEKVDALRISRRVLMNLVDALERERKEQVNKLQVMNERLQRDNCRYAKAIMYRNVRITELESKIHPLEKEC